MLSYSTTPSVGILLKCVSKAVENLRILSFWPFVHRVPKLQFMHLPSLLDKYLSGEKDLKMRLLTYTYVHIASLHGISSHPRMVPPRYSTLPQRGTPW